MAASLWLVYRSSGPCRRCIILGREDLAGGDKPSVDTVIGLVYVSYVQRLTGNVLPSEWCGLTCQW